MKKTVKSKICWLSVEEGGRMKPPLPGTRYCPIVIFKESKNDSITWSADFICTDTDNNLCSIVDFSYLMDDAPYQYLYTGNQFELYEGPKLVAKGEVL